MRYKAFQETGLAVYREKLREQEILSRDPWTGKTIEPNTPPIPRAEILRCPSCRRQAGTCLCWPD